MLSRTRYYALNAIKHEVDKVNYLKVLYNDDIPNAFVARNGQYYFVTNMPKHLDKKVKSCSDKVCTLNPKCKHKFR